MMITVVDEETIGVGDERRGRRRSVAPLQQLMLLWRPLLQGVGGLELARPGICLLRENLGEIELVEVYTIKPGW